jgi:hypothetical protein
MATPVEVAEYLRVPIKTLYQCLRSVRRSVSTSNGEPLGRVLEARLEQVDRRLDSMNQSIGEVRKWLALREGRERPPLWLPPRIS